MTKTCPCRQRLTVPSGRGIRGVAARNDAGSRSAAARAASRVGAVADGVDVRRHLCRRLVGQRGLDVGQPIEPTPDPDAGREAHPDRPDQPRCTVGGNRGGQPESPAEH
jgi:hypothetical protein